MQVLSRVCAYAVDPLAAIAVNPCEGIKHLYDNDRSEIIWAAEDIKQLYASCTERSKTPSISPVTRAFASVIS
jgi:hypothetical protein